MGLGQFISPFRRKRFHLPVLWLMEFTDPLAEGPKGFQPQPDRGPTRGRARNPQQPVPAVPYSCAHPPEVIMQTHNPDPYGASTSGLLRHPCSFPKECLQRTAPEGWQAIQDHPRGLLFEG